MKKLMITIVAVAIATVSQAASVDWSVGNSAWQLNDTSNPTAGTIVYLINGATALNTIAAAINAATGEFDAEQSWVYGSGATSGTRGKVSELTTTTDKLTRGTEYAFSVLVIDATDLSDVRYMVSGTYNQTAYKVGDDESMSVAFTEIGRAHV